MPIESVQLIVTLIVLGLQAYNSFQHAQHRAAIAELKVYMHEKFITKDEADE